jgi:crotonobetainyl-CoA:carnitine CoA-transferase CaiB-like acyl-CoA transferase
LISDVRFAGREARKQNRAALTDELEAGLRAKTAEQWETLLTRIGIPAGRVLNVPEALDTPQIRHRQLLQTFADMPGLGRSVTLTKAGFKMSKGDPEVASPPPRLGQHTTEVLREIGFADSEIERLKSVGAV